MGQAPTVRSVDSLLLICIGLTLLIAGIDWMLPAGVVFNILMCIPILMTSNTGRPAYVWVVFVLATVLYIVAAILHGAPVTAPEIWVPNRVIALVSLPGAALLARTLQQRRLDAERVRDEALSASEMNRLLFALLAHDLRSPLQLSRQTFDYLQDTIAAGGSPDPELLRDVRARIDRNLRAVDGVLAAARAGLGEGMPVDESAGRRASIADEITQEVLSFQHEAELRGKRILLDVAESAATHSMDALVLRQALAILLDNAIRYANRGEINVTAFTGGGLLFLRVDDPGPGIRPKSGSRIAGASSSGAGLGLQLCDLLLARAGGGLRIYEDDRIGRVEAWLPLSPVPDHVPVHTT